MLAEFEREGYFAQADAVAGIRARFGPEYVTGRRIRLDVLQAFRRLAPEGRVWVGSTQAWRRRTRADPPMRGMVRGWSGDRHGEAHAGPGRGERRSRDSGSLRRPECPT